ncbi:MAG TPA: hypothetical protein VNT02_05925, partial [Burkholderiales bacterium]|nr:hypothetical protein [Burkholderiales bacterium]
FNLVYAIVTECNPVAHAGTVTSYINVGIFAGAAAIQTVSTRLWLSGGQFYQAAMLPMAIAAALALVGSLAMMLRRHPGTALIEGKALAAPAA